MNDIIKWRNETIAKKMVEMLPSKGYNAYYAANLEQAKKKVLDLIPKGSSIAVGGSVTITKMGLVDIFRTTDYKFFDRFNTSSYEECYEVYRQSMLSDYLVTSTNAITKNGELVNIDSSGNRVAGMILGPKNVIIICGVNKVVDTIDEGLKRLKKIAPLNCRRLNHKTTCSEDLECIECTIHDRMCNYTTIIHHGRKEKGRINIIMVAEEVGF